MVLWKGNGFLAISLFQPRSRLDSPSSPGSCSLRNTFLLGTEQSRKDDGFPLTASSLPQLPFFLFHWVNEDCERKQVQMRCEVPLFVSSVLFFQGRNPKLGVPGKKKMK